MSAKQVISPILHERAEAGKIRHLDLSLLHCPEDEITAFIRKLKDYHNYNLESINLDHTTVTAQMAGALVEIADFMPHWRSLSMVNSRATDDFACELSTGLEKTDHHLESINLSDNINLTNLAVNYLAYSYKPESALKSLNLNYCGLDENDIMDFAKIFKRPGGIWHLDLSGNDISEKGVKFLGQQIKGYKTLVTFNMMNLKSDKLISTRYMRSPNLLAIKPAQSALRRNLLANRYAAQHYISLLRDNTLSRNKNQIIDIAHRAPAIVTLAEREYEMARPEIADFLLKIEDNAFDMGVDFKIPAHYRRDVEILREKPLAPVKSFDFNTLTNPEQLFSHQKKKSLLNTFSPLFHRDHDPIPLAYRLVEEGQAADMIDYLVAKGRPLTSEDCFMRPSENKPTLIRMAIRTGQLADIMRPDNWAHNPRAVLDILGKLPPREVERQIGGEKEIKAVLHATNRRALLGPDHGPQPH